MLNKYKFSIMLSDEAGSLSRILNIFSARNLSVDDILSKKTNNLKVTEVILEAVFDDSEIQSIVKQIEKLVVTISVSYTKEALCKTTIL